jgi:hypothetical protein
MQKNAPQAFRRQLQLLPHLRREDGRKGGKTVEKLLTLLFCHLIGDYVLQSDFIATTKGKNWWHLFVHSTLYVCPLFVVYGLHWQMFFVWGFHMLFDSLKARYELIPYWFDQFMHLKTLILFYFT